MKTPLLPALLCSSLLAISCAENGARPGHGGGPADARAEAGQGEDGLLDSTLDVTASGTAVFGVGCIAGSGRVIRANGDGAFHAFASGTTCPSSVAVGSAVFVAGLNGTGLSVFAVTDAGPSLVPTPSAPVALAASARALYYTTRDSLVVAGPDGTSPRTLLGPGRSLTRPILDGDVVWIGDRSSGAVLSLTGGGTDGGTETLASGLAGVNAVAVTSTTVFVAAGYVLMRVPKSGGPAEGAGTADGAEILAAAADERAVYFASDGVLWKLDTTGGLPVALATGLAGPRALALTPDAIYVANERAGVTRIPTGT